MSSTWRSGWGVIALCGILMLIAMPAAGEPPTSFLISGWVNESSGDPVNNPDVVIINTATGEGSSWRRM